MRQIDLMTIGGRRKSGWCLLSNQWAQK